jgi:hypothetical protein
MNASMGSMAGLSATAGMAGIGSQAAGQQRAWLDAGLAASAPHCVAEHPFPIEELGLRHLKTPEEIGQIFYLRKAIDLSVHSRALADFLALEKKETSADSSVPSNCAGQS